MNLSDYITTIPDFPQKGIMFRDITTLLQNGEAFKNTLLHDILDPSHIVQQFVFLETNQLKNVKQ